MRHKYELSITPAGQLMLDIENPKRACHHTLLFSEQYANNEDLAERVLCPRFGIHTTYAIINDPIWMQWAYECAARAAAEDQDA